MTRPEEMTAAEIDAYRAQYTGSNKGLLDSFEFWLEFRPDVLKRHKARTRHYSSAARARAPLVELLGAIHQYTIMAFREGIAYEVRLAQTNGAMRSDILDTLSVAFIHSGHRGMYAAAAYGDFLRDYEDPPADPARFPDGWRVRPAARSTRAWTTRRARRAPRTWSALLDWYERTLGEVPRYVRFLARERPGLLKAYRDRYEHAIRDSLPCQMLPWLLLNYNVVRGFGEGIRENVLLGRALGMTREQLLDAICFAVLHAGVERARRSPRRPPATCWRTSERRGARGQRVRGADPDHRRARLRGRGARRASCAALGVDVVAVIADRGFARAGLLEPLLEHASGSGVALEVCALIGEDPDVAECEAASAAALAIGADAVLAIGGGSALCAAKAVAIRLRNAGAAVALRGLGTAAGAHRRRASRCRPPPGRAARSRTSSCCTTPAGPAIS